MCTAIVPYARQIPLTQGKFALVSYWIYDWLMIWRWHAVKCKQVNIIRWYASTNSKYVNKKRMSIRMHRLMFWITDRKIYIDHVNHNGLNNLPYNVRQANHSQNAKNRVKSPNKSSKYLGVSKLTQKGFIYWQVNISKNGNGITSYIAMFKSEISAALAYNELAKHYHKEFANLNIIEQADPVAVQEVVRWRSRVADRLFS